MAAFTHRHFEVIARTLRDNAAPAAIVHELADVFAKDNPRFHKARFMEASGVRGYEKHAPCFAKGGTCAKPWRDKVHKVGAKDGHAFEPEVR